MIRLVADGNEEIGSGGGSNLPITTDETEIDTGDTLDGDTIYLKVIDLGTGPNNGAVENGHGITGLQNVVSLEVVYDNGSNRYAFPSTTSTGYGDAWVTPTKVRSQTNQNWTAYNGLAYIRYTRS